MKYKQAMKQPDKDKWIAAVAEEYRKYKSYGVFKVVKIKDIPKGAKILTTTWAMKKKCVPCKVKHERIRVGGW